MAYLAARLSSAPSLGGTVAAAISNVHLAAGLEDPTKKWVAPWIIKGGSRLVTKKKEVDGFDIEALRRWRRDPKLAVGLSRPKFSWMRNGALVALGLRTAQRPNELVSLRKRDIEFRDDGSMVVTIRSSKTDQASRGHDIYIDPTGDTVMCPVAIMKEYVNYMVEEGLMRGEEDFLFTSVRGNKPLAVGAVGSICRKVHAVLGGDEHITGKSLRVGGASLGAAAGLDRAVINSMGNWSNRSNTTARYVRSKAVMKGGISARLGFGAEDTA